MKEKLTTEAGMEAEKEQLIPVIDIVRHGETDYRELTEPEFKFDKKSLKAENLDLNPEGVKNILETADQLVARIDKEHEAVIILTSPNYRTHSSALIIEDRLLSQGVNILNKSDIREINNLRQIDFKDDNQTAEWIKADRQFRNEQSVNKSLHSQAAHQQIAERLGQELSDFFSESHDDINKRFERFIRHMTNIHEWLSPETLELLKGKRLRIVALTHEEVADKFMDKVMGSQENLKKSQVLEIRPETEVKAGEEIAIKASLLPKNGSQEKKVETIIKL